MDDGATRVDRAAARRDLSAVAAVLSAMRRYVKTLDEDTQIGENRGRSLWLSGPIGTGKSSAAA